MGVIQKLCPTSIWLDRGSIRQYGSTDTVIRGYLSQGTLNRSHVVNLEKLPRPHLGGNEFRLIAFEWLCDLPLRHGEEVKARILFQTRAPVENVAIGSAFVTSAVYRFSVTIATYVISIVQGCREQEYTR
jgi:hypothetical protein